MASLRDVALRGGVRPIGAYPPACRPYGLEAAPAGSETVVFEKAETLKS